MYYRRQFGFTLIELLVVISIIGILASAVLTKMSDVRAAARDTNRVEDMRQIQLAMQMYYNTNNHWPREADGSNGKIGEGGGLDTMLAPYLNTKNDPLGPGSHAYNYYYDGRQLCEDSSIAGAVWIAVIFVRTMEMKPGNGSDFCNIRWGGEGGAGNSNAYHVVIGESSG